ncbi:GNAT family N-acetyltransferase [Streptomyces sp. PKU-EA00015]|uniref:GNAT family N-acetyltransferase n=1 Tax=Streptomyces sp. PKU-EA00015 TaxID=2748326 RepID=UPI0015A47F8B|nr:GNAT family N-acetyltransferase [Streptomyces sp. PKU-EA00015]NWF31187.1 GNAT family N-acetyltransferase [Streptomyces sp. PKU-EA00015]
MTTTLRPTGPIQRDESGAASRAYDVCVNGRPVGSVLLATDAGTGPSVGYVRSLTIDDADRRRGRGTVAALAAEEVLRGWGCTEARTSVPADGTAALRMVSALGYTERGRNMLKDLPDGPPPLPGAVEARPMDEAEFDRWRSKAVAHYAEEWIARGVLREEALTRSENLHRTLLPEGLATPGAELYCLVAEDTVVGRVWVATRHDVRPGEQGAYVFDVEVAEEHRGRGYGRALMLLAERIARAAGNTLIGLHVFAGNTPAQRLYESLGYRTTHHNFVKRLL